MSSFLPQPPDSGWQKQAACRADGVDPKLFFPENNVAGVAMAREICKGCPVARACLAECMASEGGKNVGSRHGIYAGMSPKQRHRLYERLRDRAQRAGQTTESLPKPEPKKREPAKCGTRSGYGKHLREKTEICGPCRQANTDADNRLRRTGTSKVAA